MRAILIAILMIISAAGPLYAQPGGRGERNHRDHRGHMEKMNLTDSQKEVMHDIRAATKKQMIDVRAELQKKRLALDEIMRADTPDRSEYERISRDIADLQLRQKLLLFDSRQEIMNMLDAEQQDEFRDMQHHRKMKRAERMKRH